MSTPRPRRRYPDAQRAAALAALAANGGNLQRTARELDIPESTLEGWAKETRNPVGPELREQKKADLTGTMEDLAHKLAGCIAGKLDQMAPRDAAVALGITIDKLLLLKGLPTSISSSADAQYDLSKLSADDLRQFLAFCDKAAAPPA